MDVSNHATGWLVKEGGDDDVVIENLLVGEEKKFN